MKLNIGCGNRRLPGYTGIDAVKRDAADIIANADKIPLDDGCADEILAVHVVEHVYLWEVPDLLREWYRLLKPGGLMALEMPDLIKTCRNVIEGRTGAGKHPDQLTMWSLYGDPRTKDPYMTHRWCHTFSTLAPIVKDAGFTKIVEKETIFHPCGRGIRDFRLEARKPHA